MSALKSVEERLKEMPFDPEINRLDADEDLRRRILRAAEEKEKIPALFRGRRAAAFAAACVLVLALGGSFAYSRLHRGTETPRLLTSQPAGESAADSAVMEAEEAATAAAVFAGAERGMLDVKNGTVSISAQSAPAYRSIWASGSGSHYPVIGVNGRYYRMLTSPASVSSSLLGDVLGAVEEYTDEPALSRAGLVSNVVGQGGTVWAVRGMNGSAAAAEVNGVYRVFQRVSYAGSALMGGESFRTGKEERPGRRRRRDRHGAERRRHAERRRGRGNVEPAPVQRGLPGHGLLRNWAEPADLP